MDHNDIIKAHTDGTLPDFSPDDIETMRRICALHILNRNQFMIHPCEAVDREIKRRQDLAAEQRATAVQKELAAMKQQREAEHTLWVYWRLADWTERFGMLGVFSLVFLVGYLCAKNNVISRLIDLIISVKP